MVCPASDAVPAAERAAEGLTENPTPAELLARIRALELRVAALEEGEPGEAPALPAAPDQVPETIGGGTVLGLAGRTLLILGGAFLLRSLTDSGTLPKLAGAGLGLAYAVLWALLANRSASRGQRPWAAFQVFAAAAVAYPLLWETTVRLKALPPGLASAALLGCGLLIPGVAVRHGLRRAAWMTALGGLATGLALMAATSAIVEFAPFFILASGAALTLSGSEDWRGLRWPAALAADLAVLAMVLLYLSPGSSEVLVRDLRPGLVLAAALGFCAVHLGAFFGRALRRPKSVGGFELLQTVLVLVTGFMGAVRVAQASGAGLGLLGACALLGGLACYAGAFAFVGRQTEGSLDFKYLTSLAVVLVLAGSLLLFDHQALALACLASGIATTLLGVRYRKFSLQFHGVCFLALAALDAGLLAGAVQALAGAVAPGLASYPPAAFLTFAALAGAHLYPMARRGAGLSWQLRLPSLAFAALAVFALAGFAASAGGAFVKEPAGLAALRTALLVALAFGTALAGRWRPASELGWLPYPILACTALKVVLEDLPHGRPATLFLAFTLLGAGLLGVPRLITGKQKEG